MSKEVKSDVGMGVYGKRPSVGATQPTALKSRVSSATATPTAVPDEGVKKKKGILVNIGGRVRTLSDTTLDLLSHGTQLEITTHLMDKKLVGGFSSRQLEVAVAHARLEKEKRAGRVNGAVTREPSAERALEEAVKKYGEEAQASSASRTISAILLQYSEKPEKNPSPDPTPPKSPLHLRKRSPTPPRPSRSSRNKRESSRELIRVASPAAQRTAGRPMKKSPSRTSQTQRTSSPQVNRPSTRSHPKVSSSFTTNAERSGSRGHPTKMSPSLTNYRHFSPLRRPLSRSGNRLESLTPQQATALRNSTTKTNTRTSSGTSRSSMPVKKTKQDTKGSDPRKNQTSKPPQSQSVRPSTALPREIVMSLLPSSQKSSSRASQKPSGKFQLRAIDSYFPKRTVLKPPVPRQQGRPPTPTHSMETSSHGSRPKTAHSSSQKGILRLPTGQADRQSDPRESEKSSQSSPPVHTQRSSRSSPPVLTQRSRRSVPGERANRFFHKGKITKELRDSRREISYVPFEPEYRTITDPTYGRYRHFYMGMMDRLPPGFPVNLRNVLFPLPPPPDAPSLRRYRNPLKIPLRKVGLERDDYITRPSTDTKPFIFRPVPPAPNAWKNKPVAPPTSLQPPSRTSSISKRREDERPRQGGRPDENGNRPTLSPTETKRSNEDSSGQREQYWRLFPPTGVDNRGSATPEGQTDEDFWEIQEKRREERAAWADRIREVVRVDREFVEAYKPYFREEEEEYRQYDSNFEPGPRALLMKLLAEHMAKNKPKASSSDDEEEEERRRGLLKEPLYIPFLWEARLEPFKNISDNDYRWSMQVSEVGAHHRRRFVNWRESDLHDVYDMRSILEIYGLHEVLPFLKYSRTNDYRSTSMGTVEFLRGAVYIKGFENILLTVVSDMADSKGDKKRLGRHFGRSAKERASVRQWLTYAMTNIRGKSRLGANIWLEIESHLRTHNFFATSYYSVADVLMYLSLYPFFKPLGREKREKYPFIADFIRTIQRDENVVRANKRLMIRNWEDIPVLNRPRH